MSRRTVAAATATGALVLAPMTALCAELSITEGIFTPVAADSQEQTLDSPSESVVRLLDGGNTPSEQNSVEVLRSRSLIVDI